MPYQIKELCMSHLSNFKTALKKQGFDAAIVSENLNQRYLSNFSFHDGLILVTLKESYLITDFRYEEAARAQASRELTVVTPYASKWNGSSMLASLRSTVAASYAMFTG